VGVLEKLVRLVNLVGQDRQEHLVTKASVDNQAQRVLKANKDFGENKVHLGHKVNEDRLDQQEKLEKQGRRVPLDVSDLQVHKEREVKEVKLALLENRAHKDVKVKEVNQVLLVNGEALVQLGQQVPLGDQDLRVNEVNLESRASVDQLVFLAK